MANESSSSSNEHLSNYQIINIIIGLLGNTYTCINAFDNTGEIDLNGVVAVQLAQLEFLHNGDTSDHKLNILVTGQYLANEDVNQSKITNMFDYIYHTLDEQTIKNSIQNCAGCLINIGSINSDGEVNKCSLSLDLYICDDRKL